MNNGNRGKMALAFLRGRAQLSVRYVARLYGLTVPHVHDAAGCQEGRECRGRKCRIRPLT